MVCVHLLYQNWYIFFNLTQAYGYFVVLFPMRKSEIEKHREGVHDAFLTIMPRHICLRNRAFGLCGGELRGKGRSHRNI